MLLSLFTHLQTLMLLFSPCHFCVQHSCFRALKDNVTQARLWRIRRNLAHQLRDTTVRLAPPRQGLAVWLAQASLELTMYSWS